MENSFVLVLVIGLLSLSNFPKSSIASDTITPNETITHQKTIVSAGGRFELGFFSPKNDNSYYLGIWYKAVSPQTVVWVANRDYPILSSSASLSFGSDGNLSIYRKNTGNKKQLLIIVILTISLTVVTILSFVMLCVRGKLRRKGEDCCYLIWVRVQKPIVQSLLKKTSLEKVGKMKLNCHYLALQVFLLRRIISQLQISSGKVVLDLFTKEHY
ncbi:hypothetical protein Dsin_022717 [Dipteronia sinensis]|uniref:Bulb-type lectin domain-containing protein n=1 Tax=Dipteronia sinensis TaxID=43782 RepID=A0AAE0E1E6_9ROSI|nr:hypothetical protein Dsin_022717 [Dipteronia sinensis]